MKAKGGKSKKKRREKDNESTHIKKRKEKTKIAAGHYAYQPILLYFLKEQALPFL